MRTKCLHLAGELPVHHAFITYGTEEKRECFKDDRALHFVLGSALASNLGWLTLTVNPKDLNGHFDV